MQIVQDELTFDLKTGAPSAKQKTHSIPNRFDEAFVVLRGFRVGFANGEDHHFGQVTTDLSCTANIDAQTVTVSGTLGLRDKSTDFDDKYSGEIYYTVIMEP